MTKPKTTTGTTITTSQIEKVRDALREHDLGWVRKLAIKIKGADSEPNCRFINNIVQNVNRNNANRTSFIIQGQELLKEYEKEKAKVNKILKEL